MKKLLFLLLLLPALAGRSQDIPARPNPPRLVNDYTNTLTADQRDALERKLVAYDDSTSTQIAVVLVKTIGDGDIEDYALKILRQWGVGNKQKDNGVVLLVALDDHKIRIETGHGMEGSIPDVTAAHIIESSLAPNFRQQNYYRGLDQATDDIMQAAAGEYKAPEGYRKGKGRGTGIGAGFIVLIIIIIIISRINRGGGGGMMSRRGSNLWLLPFLMNDWGRGSGGGWGGGGGGGWSGGGGGGGFGGFGGGSGGGGGASGGW